MIEDLRANLLRRADEVVEVVGQRMHRLAGAERFEEARAQRDRLAAFVRAASRRQRLGALTGCAEIVAARREDDRRWSVHVIRHGRLAAAGVIPPGAHAGHYVAEADLTSAPARAHHSFTPAAWDRLRALRERYDPDGVFSRYPQA